MGSIPPPAPPPPPPAHPKKPAQARATYTLDTPSTLRRQLHYTIYYPCALRSIIYGQSSLFFCDIRFKFSSEDDYAEGIGSAAKYSHMISFIQLSASHVLVIDRWNHCLRWVYPKCLITLYHQQSIRI